MMITIDCLSNNTIASYIYINSIDIKSLYSNYISYRLLGICKGHFLLSHVCLANAIVKWRGCD